MTNPAPRHKSTKHSRTQGSAPLLNASHRQRTVCNSGSGQPEKEKYAMAQIDQETDLRFIKLMLSSLLKTIDTLHPDIDAAATVREHMLGICAGVRDRALAMADSHADPQQATAHVDELTQVINGYFEYAAQSALAELNVIKAGDG